MELAGSDRAPLGLGLELAVQARMDSQGFLGDTECDDILGGTIA
jgi:hypothetical protein